MKRSVLWLCIVALSIFFFTTGSIFGYVSFLVTNPHFQELNRYELEELMREARSFFYETLYGLFEENYNSEDDYVSKSALEGFEEYRSMLEPRCRLVNLGEGYCLFYGEVFFPSGDTFEVQMRRSDKGWKLDSFRYLGNKQIWCDLSLYNKKSGTR